MISVSIASKFDCKKILCETKLTFSELADLNPAPLLYPLLCTALTDLNPGIATLPTAFSSPARIDGNSRRPIYCHWQS